MKIGTVKGVSRFLKQAMWTTKLACNFNLVHEKATKYKVHFPL